MRVPGYLLLLLFASVRIPFAADIPRTGSADDLSGASIGLTNSSQLEDDDALEPAKTPYLVPPLAPIIRPAPQPPEKPEGEIEIPGVQWRNILRQSAMFTGLQHGFRLATEPGTRGAKGPFWKSYAASVASLHGWSDGDPFYVNYLGHPMQGAISGYIWAQNDPRYRTVQFGANARYWRSRLRATAFSFAYSEQLEIGPFSEASIGFIQSRWPQQGFVDHVVTPIIGTGWMVAEDALDRFVVSPLEKRTDNPYVRMMLRGWLNPSRSFANILRYKVPWHRDTRPGIFVTDRSVYDITPHSEPVDLMPYPEIAPIEVSASGYMRQFGGGLTCTGGGGAAAFRLTPNWQLVADVGGCKIQGLHQNLSGDSLMYLLGPRWTPVAKRRWSPYAHVLVGGNRITLTEEFPDLKELALLKSETGKLGAADRQEYAVRDDTNAFALAAGTGIDLKLNRAMAFRVASLEYTKSWAQRVQGTNFSNGGMQFSAGVVLRVGTW